MWFFCDDDIVKSSAGPKFAMYFTVTPVSELSSIAWSYVAKDYENIPDEETQQFEDMITLQDVPIVESQGPNFCRWICRRNCIFALIARLLPIASG